MKLQEIEFGNILGASGVQGFFGEGYWFHKAFGPLGPDFPGMTFVSKTATAFSRKGHMPLRPDYTPVSLFPDCIVANPIKGTMLNSVGVSNPGIDALLNTGKWQENKEPFLISVMSSANTPEERLDELHRIADCIKMHKPHFSAPFGVQVNLSCPNTDEDPKELIGESENVLEALRSLDVPLIPKYSIASAPIEVIMELDDNPHCAGICVSNALPFGWEGLDWKKEWGSKVSPLLKYGYGKGGLSGEVLRPLVCEWIATLRDRGFTKPINGGGGILHPDHVNEYHKAGASSVFIGSVAALRPWRVTSIIERAHSLNWE